MPLISAYNIQKTTSCDMAFVHSVKYLKTKEWVLRWNKKGSRPAPYFFTKVPSKVDKRIKSSAHAKFLEKLGAPISKGGSWDRCKKLGIVKYTTANRIV